MTNTLELPSLDPTALIEQSVAEGWGDGLPIIPATRDRVAEFVVASGQDGSQVLGVLPPLRTHCTVEQLAINAVLAGAPAKAMPLMCAAVKAMADPRFDLGGINVTTNSVVPALVVNGPVRDAVGIPYQYSVFGGVAGPAPAIGRALRLLMRNVAGQTPGQSTEATFGQPGRVAGIVVAEWEDHSPWAPLAERRGVAGDAVTVFGTLGTANIMDTISGSALEVLTVIGKSLAYMGNNHFNVASQYAEQMVAINTVWANELIAKEFPRIEDVAEVIWEHARIPLDAFPDTLRPHIERRGRIDDKGRVWLMETPDELHIIVCGGLGNVHATMLPGFSHSVAITESVG